MDKRSEVPVIRAKGITKRFRGSTAIKDVSFEVRVGEVVGFVGLNGAGKSTTINVLLGFLNASGGTVELFGRPLTPRSAHRSHFLMGYASGDMDLPQNLTGAQYLRFVGHQYGLRDDIRLKELGERFQPQLDKKIGELSRGNRQKIALIAAFLASPKLVILDEPSSGLDPKMQQQFLDLVREEAAKGTTIFMSSHYLQEVAESCSRILLIRDGVITRDFAASELEKARGKHVSVRVGKAVAPPEYALQIEKSKGSLSFLYHGTAAELQAWIATVDDLEDISINDHDPEAVFEELYEAETSNA